MDDRLSELKEKQTEIGNKISLLQATNKRKDEEAAEIRKLIAECRENLNRIKSVTPVSENLLPPCEGYGSDGERDDGREVGEGLNRDSKSGSMYESKGRRAPDDLRKSSCSCAKDEEKPCSGKPKKKKKKGPKERVSCKVDLNKMKVRIRGPPEDLKKLDATQLINLLEKFECQELIINTGDEFLQDPGEIRLIYFLHPGNIVMVAGIIMIAFLINSNIIHGEYCKKVALLLKVLYVGSSAFHYGMVLWMIFIRGFALKFGLNQDMFHIVDNLMLPKYFSVCVLLSALALYSFLATYTLAPCTSWPLWVVAQIIIVVTLFFTELITICYVVPAIIKLREATDDYLCDDEEPNELPQSYEKNSVKLNKLSWTLCLINFLSLVLLGANIYFITSRLNIGKAN